MFKTDHKLWRTCKGDQYNHEEPACAGHVGLRSLPKPPFVEHGKPRRLSTPMLGPFLWGASSNGDLGGGVHLCLMDMTAFGASHGPVLEAGAGRRNALDRRATLASRAAG